MKKATSLMSICVIVLMIPSAGRGQVTDPNPTIAFLLPAGGQRGSAVDIMIRGGRLFDVTDVLLRDGRFQASVVHRHRNTLDPSQRELRSAIQRAMELVRRGESVTEELRNQMGDYPLLWALTNPEITPTEKDLRRIEYEYFGDRPRPRPNLSMAQCVRVRLAIPADTEPGRYEIRLRSRFGGTTNPLYFMVGDCPEILETEPCTPDQRPTDPPLRLPICVNGQIYPGDVDIYRFHASAGQTVSLHAAAREFKPFIADAVPGWFEAMLTLYDPEGNEIAYSDCTQFQPDPTLIYTVPRDGVYTVHLRDSLYRGRWDFVYRLTIREHVPSSTRKFAHTIAQPEAVNMHRFAARKGRDLIIRTEARVHGSPIDTFIQVADKNGEVLAENDDAAPPVKVGLQTAFTDSHLRFTPPADGTYYVRVADTAELGGPEYGYELKIAPPAPGFDLYVTPSTLNAVSGRGVPVSFSAVRRDGFEDEIDIRVTGATHGFRLDRARIPPGQNTITAVLFAPGGLRQGSPMALEFEGTAHSADGLTSKTAISADDWEQAFIYHHLVPTDSFLVFPRFVPWPSPRFSLTQRDSLRLDPAKPAVMELQLSSRGSNEDLDFRLVHAPEGVSLDKSVFRNGQLDLSFSAEKTVAERGNIIVETLATKTIWLGGNERQAKLSMGVLPAIPYGP